MMRRVWTNSAVVLAVLLAAAQATAQAAAQDAETLADLLNSPALTCTFPAGARGAFGAGAAAEVAGGLAGPVRFAAIDPRAYRARLVDEGGEGPEILLLRTQIGLTFVEENEVGGIHTTTVYGVPGPDGAPFAAVHSRHFLGSEGPEPVQVYGGCEPAE